MGLAVQKMFDGIAQHYDFLNHFLSAGRDRAWRKKAALGLGSNRHLRVLDLCGGTGDFWKTWSDLGGEKPIGIEKNGSKNIPRSVIADFSFGMLLEAKKKFADWDLQTIKNQNPSPKPYLVRMDALKPCFKERSFDAIICAYGMRNLDSIPKGIEAISPLVPKGGIFLTLEFFRPTTRFTKFFYGIIAPLCIPFLGWFFSSKREAYVYLVDSIRNFFSVAEYGKFFEEYGFKKISILPCDFGISHIVKAEKG